MLGCFFAFAVSPLAAEYSRGSTPKGSSLTLLAGKGIYETVRRGRAGVGERVFTHSLLLAYGEDGQRAAAECFSFVRTAAASAAADKREVQVPSEGSELLETAARLMLRCGLVALF
jgi:hypothetical protein